MVSTVTMTLILIRSEMKRQVLRVTIGIISGEIKKTLDYICLTAATKVAAVKHIITSCSLCHPDRMKRRGNSNLVQRGVEQHHQHETDGKTQSANIAVLACL